MTAPKEHKSLLHADGFEDAFLGVCYRFGQPPIVTYDYGKCIDILCADMSREEAHEYFEFNVIGAWVGETTPAFVRCCAVNDAEILAAEGPAGSSDDVLTMTAEEASTIRPGKTALREPATSTYTDDAGTKYKLIVNSRGMLTRVRIR